LIITSWGYSQIPSFNQDKSYYYLKKQCEFGPRNPDSEGHKACLKYLTEELKSNADTVLQQPFLFTFPYSKKTITLYNVIAGFGFQKERILLCAHWDTRPWADQDPDPENRKKPIIGANDGASGVAVLLELANILNKYPPRIGVDIVLFDGEDAGVHSDPETWCQGSRFFAQNIIHSNFPAYAILLDFVGDSNLHFPIEVYSNMYVPDLVDMIWSKAEELNLNSFDSVLGYQIIDDHLELLKVGIPAVNIIDFEYPYYHTLQDTEDKCSPESLGIVGTLLVHLIYE
jgi:hypothetical protein